MTASPLHFDVALPPLTLESGPRLPHLIVRGWWWGPSSDGERLAASVSVRPPAPEDGTTVVRRDAAAVAAVPTPRGRPLDDASVPTVLCVHALTGDARVGGDGGWWAPLVGPGKPLDPRQVRLLCFNNLGSCYGTTGAADVGFPRLSEVTGPRATPDKGAFRLPEDALPAPISTWDQARTILLALDALGVGTVDLLCGGSVGGMVALALAALAPERFPRVVPIATLDRATPWMVGWNHIGRQTVALALAQGVDPDRALALARELAHMTYRASPGLMARHGRRMAGTELPWSPTAPYAVQTYLEHQGGRLVARYDARAYVSQLDAMDHHDLGRSPPPPDPHESWTRPSGWPGLARLTGRLDAVAISSDQLFFADEIHDLVVRHRLHDHEGTWHLVHSPHGHDAFLMAWEPLATLLRTCVRRIDPERFV